MAQHPEKIMSVKIENIAFGNDSLKLKLGKAALPCFILKNNKRVVDKQSIPKALGYDGKSENWLFEFLLSINRLTPIEPALLEALGKSIPFQRNIDSPIKHGIEAKLFLEACIAIVKANNEGFLYLSELRFAKAAEEILNAVEGQDIEKLIDFASGYELFKQNHKEFLSRFMSKQLDANFPWWIKSLSESFFDAIFDFRGWQWQDLNQNPGKVGNYINDLIFSRIEAGLMEILETTKPKMKYRKPNTAEQYLEHPQLKDHISAVMALMKASGANQAIFEQLINKGFPKKRDLKLVETETNEPNKKTANVKRAVFNESLQKAVIRKK